MTIFLILVWIFVSFLILRSELNFTSDWRDLICIPLWPIIWPVVLIGIVMIYIGLGFVWVVNKFRK
jgi:hypothetical protein